MTLTGPLGAGAVPTSSSSAPVRSPLAAVTSLSPAAVMSDPTEVVVRALPGAAAGQGSLWASCVGALEDPVLPGREPAEDLRFGGLRAGEPEVGLHAGQGVGREAGALLDDQAYLVGPVQRVRCLGDQAQPDRVRCGPVRAG